MFRSITANSRWNYESNLLRNVVRKNTTSSVPVDSESATRRRGIPLATEWEGIDLLAIKQAPFASTLAKSRPSAKQGLNQLFRCAL